VAGVDEADPRIVQRVERGQVALAGDAEDQLDAVKLELIDQDLAARAQPRAFARPGFVSAWVGAALSRAGAGGTS
jgi:hypothetical protein